jgi:hypothetical protein
MNQTKKTYLGLGVVFVLSFLTARVLPTTELLKGIAATPGVAALIAVVYQLLRDQAAFERSRYLQRQQQVFNFASTSHMANVAFDKHVEFCEKYMEEVHSTITTFFRDGPTAKALNHAANFLEIRRRYSAWLPKEISLGLEPFEKAVGQIGASHHLVEALSAQQQDNAGRRQALDEMYATFKQVMQLKGSELLPEHKEVAIEEVKEKVRSIVGIDELTEMRKRLMAEALSFLKTDA